MRVSFKSKNIVSTLKYLKLIHLYLFGHSRTRGLRGNYYEFVIVDDYSKFTWTLFLTHKEETFKTFVKFSKRIQNLFNLKNITLCSDHGGEFVSHQF